MPGLWPISASSAAGWDERRTSHHGEGLEGAPWLHDRMRRARRQRAPACGANRRAEQPHRCALGPRLRQHVNRGAARCCR